MEKETVKRMLIEAYSNKFYQVQLYTFKDEIDEILSKLIIDVKSIRNDLNIFEDPHSRVKKIKSFSEKIVKKHYYKWIEDENETQQSIQEKIGLNLTDVIGFRFNCYFFNEEEIVYNTIKSIFDDFDISGKKPHKYQEIELNFNENTQQKNGRKIYKFSGTYKNQVKFEVQIKSMIKDLWGEVEHHTTYKAKRIDSKKSVKERIQNESLIILESIDKELEFLYKDLSEPDQLIKELFFQYSYIDISDKNKDVDIVPAYLIFFNLITRLDLEMDIKTFVGHFLIRTELKRKKLTISPVLDDDLLKRIEKYNSEVFSTVLDIFDLIYEIDSNRNLTFLLASMFKKEKTYSESAISNDDFDVFSEVPENNDSELNLNVFLEDLGIKEV
jgi:ppGpp synthetase/RelA/SpoT-type nucleotidyltranferase